MKQYNKKELEMMGTDKLIGLVMRMQKRRNRIHDYLYAHCSQAKKMKMKYKNALTTPNWKC